MNNHPSPGRINTQSSDLPIAHIEAQDVTLALPVREYLELNGCAVVVNRNPAIAPTYHIVIGDEDFVKDSVADSPKNHIEIFAIIFLRNKKQYVSDSPHIHVKIACVFSRSLGTREVERIFAYFITGCGGPYYEEGYPPPDEGMKIIPHDDERQSETIHVLQHVHPLVNDTVANHQERITRAMSEFVEEPLVHPEIRRVLWSPLPFSAVPPRLAYSVALLLASFFIVPLVWYFSSIGFVGLSQMRAFQALKNGNATGFANAAGSTTFWALQGQRTLRFMSTTAGSVGIVDLFRNQERLLGVAAGLGDVETRAARLMGESATLLPTFFQAESEPGREPLLVAVDRMRTNLDDLSNVLQLVSAQLEVLSAIQTFPLQFISGQQIIPRAQSSLLKAITQVSQARNLLSLYRIGGGFDGKKTYLILLQNSMELRPTGGFIGSLATVSIENGIMELPQIQDVYVVDGQLKGHVDPPTPIKELLEQEHWYLRDSNWNPDFAISGEKAAWFYEKETGIKVDGVIAVSTPVLTELLGATGPIELPDYNDRISKDNFFGKSLFYTQADFFPGSTQKKDFLGSLGSALIGRLTSTKAEEGSSVFLAITNALLAGDIQFWFPAAKPQRIAQQAGWTGKLMGEPSCQIAEHPCVVDRIAIVEANMGVNKVNAYIKRNMKSRVDIDEQGIIDGSVSVTYENSSTNDAVEMGGGVYLSYVRAYMPADAQVVSVTADGQEIPLKPVKTTKRIYPYRDTDTVADTQQVVAVAFTVPPMASRTITIRYQMGTVLSFPNNEGVFVHVLRKQPGVIDTDVDVAIGYPSGWKAKTEKSMSVPKDNGFLANAKEVRYNTTLDQTKEITIHFSK
ncbi:MAG: DUF4012 domain-containing protein [Candidatus Gottesmanbacteria bacterium]|nr:DUF4012 domain-containing protein [Candidatus Gottesmanbacteria bacterium]